MANGSDAITGISFDGWSYNWELDNGRPVKLVNITTGKFIGSKNGVVTVQVSNSSAALSSHVCLVPLRFKTILLRKQMLINAIK